MNCLVGNLGPGLILSRGRGASTCHAHCTVVCLINLIFEQHQAYKMSHPAHWTVHCGVWLRHWSMLKN